MIVGVEGYGRMTKRKLVYLSRMLGFFSGVGYVLWEPHIEGFCDGLNV